MGGRVCGALAALAASLALVPAAAAQDGVAGQNDFGGFANVLPAGQGETANVAELIAAQGGSPPPTYLNQLDMYNAAVGAAPGLDMNGLPRLFKPAGFGVRSADVASTIHPRPGVTIVRDSQYQVPHVYGETRADVAFGAGYATAQDRLFLMDVLRHTGRGTLTELAGPGTNDANVKMDAQQLLVADYSEDELQRMIDVGAASAGAEGAVAKADLVAYVEGVNKYIAEARLDLSKMPAEYAALGFPEGPTDWKLTDSAAVASLIGGIFGRGGGAEAAASQVLSAARQRFGSRRAKRVFADFRREDDAEAPTTSPRRFPFDRPGRVKRKAVAVTDLGSLQPRNPIVSGSDAQPRAAASGADRGWVENLIDGGLVPSKDHSNSLLVGPSRSKSGRALGVIGVQVGYYSPEILLELDLHGPGYDARGGAFPGISQYVLLGHGQDWAWSATTATTDVVDEFAEKLCNPDGSRPTTSSTSYVYKGKCIPFESREHVLETRTNPTSPGEPRTITMRTERSVHGPIQARATVRGVPVAISEARSTYKHELESALAFKRFNANEVHDPKSFRKAVSFIDFAFNWFYVDNRNIAWQHSGWYPRRAKGTDPNLPAWGTGAYDWQKFKPDAFTSRRLPASALPNDTNPSQGYLVNWNNKQARGWRSADDQWAYSSVHRSELLEKPLRRELRKRKIDLARLARVMELGATIDPRGRELWPVIRKLIGSTSGDAAATEMVGLMDGWLRDGAHRRDLNGDNIYEHSAAVAVMDEWWPSLLRAVFQPALGGTLLDRIREVASFGQPPPPDGSAFGTGWWGQLDKDLRRVLGERVRQPLSRKYCGSGSRRACRRLILKTLEEAGEAVRERYQVPQFSRVEVPATCGSPRTCDQIEFTTAGGVETPPIPWQNRPTFQQAVEVQGHR